MKSGTVQTKLASSRTAPYQQVIRARIVLQAECGCSNNAISRRLGVSVDGTVASSHRR